MFNFQQSRAMQAEAMNHIEEMGDMLVREMNKRITSSRILKEHQK